MLHYLSQLEVWNHEMRNTQITPMLYPPVNGNYLILIYGYHRAENVNIRHPQAWDTRQIGKQYSGELDFGVITDLNSPTIKYRWLYPQRADIRRCSTRACQSLLQKFLWVFNNHGARFHSHIQCRWKVTVLTVNNSTAKFGFIYRDRLNGSKLQQVLWPKFPEMTSSLRQRSLNSWCPERGSFPEPNA